MLKEYLKKLRNDKGFTMIEMMVVLIIIAVLIGVGIKFYLGYIEGAKVTKAKGQISTMQAAMDSWFAEKGEYPAPPADGEDLTDATSELKKAGIRPTKDDKYVLDSWGKNYKFTRVDDGGGKNNKYTIKTGYDKVQGTDNQIVSGTGTDGKSETPDVVVATP